MGSDRLDQVQQAGIGPVKVLEDEQRGLLSSERFDEVARRREKHRSLIDRMLGEPREQRICANTGCGPPASIERLDAAPEPLTRFIDQVGLRDLRDAPRSSPRTRRSRCSPRTAATCPESRALRAPPRNRQARGTASSSPIPGDPRTLSRCGCRCATTRSQVVRASSSSASRPSIGPLGTTSGVARVIASLASHAVTGASLPLTAIGSTGSQRNHLPAGALGLTSDQDASLRGDLLEAPRQVDGVSHHRALATVLRPHGRERHLTSVEPYPEIEPTELVRVLGGVALKVEPGPNRLSASSSWAPALRRPPSAHRHHLVDPTSVAVDDLSHLSGATVDHQANFLGVGGL